MAQLKVNYGKLNLKKVSFDLDKDQKVVNVEVKYKNKIVPCRFIQTGFRCEIELAEILSINTDQLLTLKIS